LSELIIMKTGREPRFSWTKNVLENHPL